MRNFCFFLLASALCAQAQSLTNDGCVIKHVPTTVQTGGVGMPLVEFLEWVLSGPSGIQITTKSFSGNLSGSALVDDDAPVPLCAATANALVFVAYAPTPNGTVEQTTGHLLVATAGGSNEMRKGKKISAVQIVTITDLSITEGQPFVYQDQQGGGFHTATLVALAGITSAGTTGSDNSIGVVAKIYSPDLWPNQSTVEVLLKIPSQGYITLTDSFGSLDADPWRNSSLSVCPNSSGFGWLLNLGSSTLVRQGVGSPVLFGGSLTCASIPTN